MSNPWLDDLSEDWLPQPASSPPPSVSSASHNSSEIQSQPRSRIPRLRSSPAPASLLNAGTPNDTNSASPRLPGKRKSILAERSNSDNNILRNDANDAPSRSHSRSVSASSAQSVVRHGTIETTPSDLSPEKAKKPQDTPEWKRRLIHGKMGYGDQRDLFSPMGLENIFQQPANSRSPPGRKRKSGLSMLKDSMVMPSSPPPWPSQNSHAQSSPTRTTRHHNDNSRALNGVMEDESERDEDEPSEQTFEEYDDASDDASGHGCSERDDADEASFQSQHAHEGSSEHDQSDFRRQDAQDAASAQKSRIVSGQTDMTDDSFSPVFISKQHTKDGGVEYAALDLSKSQLENLRNRAAERDSSNRSDIDDSQHIDHSYASSFAKLRSEALPEGLPVGTPDQITVGDFVSIKRGGFSADGSFRQRPLSPSPLGRKMSSDNVEDSTSLSHKDPTEDVPSLERPASKLRNQYLPRPMSPPLSPKTPARRPDSSYLIPERPTSSGSPLKLFGAHDTFTANKLQRRMSQLEDTLLQGEQPSESKRSSTGSPTKRLETRLPSLEEASFQSPGGATNYSAIDDDDEQTEEQESMRQSNGSYFGRGELDEYPFPENSFPSSQEFSDQERQTPSPARPPQKESMPKFQFSLNDGMTQQTIHTKRKLSRHTVRSWTTTVTNKNSIKIPKSPRLGARELVAVHDEIGRRGHVLEVSEGKRPPTSPFKNPTAKRRRTLHSSELETAEDNDPNAVHESRAAMQSVLDRRRNETHHESSVNVADPAILSRRNILRPRNPTPSQRRREQIQADILEATEAYLYNSATGLQAIQEHLESPTSRDLSSDAEDERAVASQIAAFTIKLNQGMKDDERKRSVTTQDFLDEARLIMDHIRARGRPNSGLESLAESGWDAPSEMQSDLLGIPESPLSFSRPPSREGSKGGWRNPGAAANNPRVVSHLRKFQEKDGEDFMVSSFRSFNVKQLEDRTVDDSDIFEGQSPDIRILANNLTQRHRRGQSDATQPGSRDSGHADSHQSRPSTMDSSMGRTNMTNLSRRSDNVATLAPEAVAHLIPQEVAGMSFDREKGIWVKRRSANNPPTSSADISNVTGSEDDPLRSIPDLTVDEIKELRRISQYPPSPEAHVPREGNDFLQSVTSADGPSMGADTEGSAETDRPQTRESAEVHHTDASTAPSRYSSHFSSSGPQADTRATSLSEKQANYLGHKQVPRASPIPEVPSSPGNESVDHEINVFECRTPSRIRTRRVGNVTISFSSSHSSQGTAPFDEGDTVPDEEIGFDQEAAYAKTERREASEVSRRDYYREEQKATTPLKRDFATPKPACNGFRRATKQTDYSPSPLRNESKELSIIQHPDSEKKRMRFQVSLSKSLGSPAVAQGSPIRYPYADVTFMLSELPDFTVNQVDERELPNRTLAKRAGTSIINTLEDRFMQGTIELVKALQDNEPDEPFWEDLRHLELQDKDLPTLHRLDELCYRVEALDVSNNHIAQLTGAPSSLRRLNIQNNCLTSLTSWGHLTNLQYLDVSDNSIDNLKGFAMLVHLRELRADRNQIDSLEGVMELDGLLKLSLRGNRLSRVDFEGAYLDRLTDVDLSGNDICNVRSLEALPALERLCLDDNNYLVQFPSQIPSSPAWKIKHLSLNRNRLSKLDISSFPALVSLSVDSNKLASIGGIESLRNLRILSARDQQPHAPFDTTPFLANPDLAELYLSTNTIPTFNFPHDRPFLNLNRLELASCGLHTLPDRFGQLAPNVRYLNLNFNALKDLRPLLNVKRLDTLLLVGNRLARLRRNVLVLSKLETLVQLDLRNNAFNVGFYAPPVMETRLLPRPASGDGLANTDGDDGDDGDADECDDEDGPHIVAPADRERDRQYKARLDADTQLRRRVYEMLVAHSCKRLRRLDGLPFARGDIVVRDEVWERLVLLGVVRRKGKGGESENGKGKPEVVVVEELGA